jgi:hypothetical protein
VIRPRLISFFSLSLSPPPIWANEAARQLPFLEFLLFVLCILLNFKYLNIFIMGDTCHNLIGNNVVFDDFFFKKKKKKKKEKNFTFAMK